MKRKICWVLLVLCFFASVFSGCQKPEETKPTVWHAKEITFSRTAARELHSDGWLYSFIFHKMKDPVQNARPDLIHYEFQGLNLRYAYNMQDVREKTEVFKDKKLLIRYVNALQFWGNQTEAQRHDRDVLQNQILRQNASVEELLSLQPSDYVFEDLDGELFFRLMREALTSDPLPEPSRIEALDKPTYAMLQEPDFIDGYKFQIAFVACMGAVEEVYIDVLYRDETQANGYRQLSDIVENGQATDQQEALFSRIKECENRIRGAEELESSAKDLTKGSIAGVNLTRLHTFLTNIDSGDYSQYIMSQIILSEEYIN